MDNSSSRDKESKVNDRQDAKEANSTAQHFVDFTEEEEDLALRMYSLVGEQVGAYSRKNSRKDSRRSRDVLV